MKTFGERLKAARELRDLSQNELARRSGVGQGQVSRLERGNHSPGKVWELARTLRVRPEWLAEGEGPMELPGLGAGRIAVPHFDVRISAGPGAIVEEEAKTGVFTCPIEVLRRYARNSESFAMVTASGDSMIETIHDGELLLVDLSIKEVTGRPGVYVLVDEQETLVKRLYNMDKFLIIKSDNSSYEPRRLGRKAASHVRIVGKVVAVWRAI